MQPSQKKKKQEVEMTEEETKTLKNTTSSVCVAITCSDKLFRSFYEPFLLFFFYSGGGVKGGVSRVGWVQADTRVGFGGGEGGVQLPRPERWTGQRQARSAPKQLQLLPSRSLQLCTGTHKHKHLGYSQRSPNQTVNNMLALKQGGNLRSQ